MQLHRPGFFLSQNEPDDHALCRDYNRGGRYFADRFARDLGASSTARPEFPQQQWYCQTLHEHGEGNYSKCYGNDYIVIRHLVR